MRVDSSHEVLVTGATGFIGRYLVRALLDRGASVSVLTRNVSRIPPEWRSGAVRLIEGDLLEATVKDICEHIDTVFHLASHSENLNGDAVDDHHRLSVNGTRALLEKAKRARVKRFVYVSSIKAMGEVTDGCANEATVARPISGYGKAKLAAERLVSGAGAAAGLATCSLRLPMVYGPNPKSNLVHMIAAVDRGRFPPLPETGNRRSMVHVDDVVQALLLAAESRAVKGGEVYLVTDGRSYSTRQIYEAICKALGRPVPKWTVPLAAFRLAGMAGDAIARITGRIPPVTSAAVEKLLGSAWYGSDKIQRELGYKPSRDLYSAIPEMVRKYREGFVGKGQAAETTRESVSGSVHR